MWSFLKIGQKKLTFNGCRIYYHNQESVDQTIDEIFREKPYHFETDKKQPLIIDAGSNIGIATLFFKQQYPDSNILCFEPDPEAFKLLKKNVTCNHLEDVKLINAALSDQEGEVNFFGQVYMKDADARGNSLIDTWGLQRQRNDTIKVQAVKLSSYINQEVDFLKIDIEGAEQRVLEELEQADKLKFIKHMSLEVHMAEQMDNINNAYFISQLLKRNHFILDINEKNIEDILPEPVQQWAKAARPRLFTIRAKRL